MKSERYLIKKIIEKIVGTCIVPISMVIGLTFVMGFYYERNIYVKLNDFTVELGSELPEEITKYMNLITNKSNLAIESSAPLDEDGHTTMIGKFSYYLVYNDSDYRFSKLTNSKSTITVVDTIKPTVTVKEGVKIKYEGEFGPDDVAECFDLSGCKMEVLEEIDTTQSGDYEVNIVATDGASNKSYAKTTITVEEKPKPAPVVVYSYNPYAGFSFPQMDAQNNAKNAELSEEEKANLRQTLVNFALQFVGNPYVYGGTSLTNGTDCSGFTMSVYANFGYALPRVAIHQGSVGIPVDASQLLPGDIVVYYHGHVGIYVGGGMMVHAGTPQTGITYQPMYDDYRTYRRIIY